MAVLPDPCRWDLPDLEAALPGEDVVATGADLDVSTVFEAYCRGMFPMHLSTGELAWWSPDPRGVLPLDALRVTRSLRQSMKSFTYTVDRDFAGVMHDVAIEAAVVEEELVAQPGAATRLDGHAQGEVVATLRLEERLLIEASTRRLGPQDAPVDELLEGLALGLAAGAQVLGARLRELAADLFADEAVGELLASDDGDHEAIGRLAALGPGGACGRDSTACGHGGGTHHRTEGQAGRERPGSLGAGQPGAAARQRENRQGHRDAHASSR